MIQLGLAGGYRRDLMLAVTLITSTFRVQRHTSTAVTWKWLLSMLAAVRAPPVYNVYAPGARSLHINKTLEKISLEPRNVRRRVCDARPFRFAPVYPRIRLLLRNLVTGRCNAKRGARLYVYERRTMRVPSNAFPRGKCEALSFFSPLLLLFVFFHRFPFYLQP